MGKVKVDKSRYLEEAQKEAARLIDMFDMAIYAMAIIPESSKLQYPELEHLLNRNKGENDLIESAYALGFMRACLYLLQDTTISEAAELLELNRDSWNYYNT